MIAKIKIKKTEFEVDFSNGNDISIPLNFNGEQPNTYGVDKATSKPFRDEQFVGDTRQGGPCNFETYSFTPHCNGTHTECIGHITNEIIFISESLKDEFIPSTLVSVKPKSTSEKYKPELNYDDLVITNHESGTDHPSGTSYEMPARDVYYAYTIFAQKDFTGGKSL